MADFSHVDLDTSGEQGQLMSLKLMSWKRI